MRVPNYVPPRKYAIASARSCLVSDFSRSDYGGGIHCARTVQVRRDYTDFVSAEFARLFIGKLARFAGHWKIYEHHAPSGRAGLARGLQ
jgi:hypothetical protein